MKEKYNDSNVTIKQHQINKQADEIIKEAILNFRVQLLELSKVWELCEKFCSKYIGTLNLKNKNNL